MSSRCWRPLLRDIGHDAAEAREASPPCPRRSRGLSAVRSRQLISRPPSAKPRGRLQVMVILTDSRGCCSMAGAGEKPGGLCGHVVFCAGRGMGRDYPSLVAPTAGSSSCLGGKATSAEVSHQPQLAVTLGQLPRFASQLWTPG